MDELIHCISSSHVYVLHFHFNLFARMRMYAFALLAHMTCTPEPISKSTRSEIAHLARLVGVP